MKTSQNNTIDNKKFFFISSDPNGIHQQCEYITDDDIEEFIQESYFVTIDSYT
jgi:hypothetical protein